MKLITPLEVVANWKLDFCLAGVLTYIFTSRDSHKLENLKKARWFLDEAISRLEAEE